ncbi:MAG: type II secretion system F family protein [Acidobacteria bacterium]|nr:type II secretion system F family protein [Acidobacteriota bacterium]MCB9378482.1 type II secretion system F family protein [Holophagales bacterium]
MEFVCRVGTPDGRVERMTRAASDEEALREELEREGMHVFGIERSLPLPSFGNLLGAIGLRRRKKISYSTLLVFNQELAALLKAGLPLLQAINLMLERLKDPVLREVLVQVRDRVKSGVELSDAFAEFGDLFPPLYASTLRAGERTGELEQVIRRFLRYLRLVLEARKRVYSALVYPMVLVGLAVGMLLVMSIFVVPRFTVFYDAMDLQLPFLTRVTVGISVFLRENLVLIVLGLAVAAGFWSRWKRTEKGRLAVDRLRLRVPFIGPVLHRFAVAEFCRSLSTLLSGGMPLVPALEISQRAVSNAHIRARLAPTLQKVREGQALYMALEATEVFEDLAIDMVKVGEATGALDQMLSSIADFLDEEVEVRMQRILSLIEPLMLIVMGALVAILLLSVYLPLFSALGNVR